jgi:hypothetical protein
MILIDRKWQEIRQFYSIQKRINRFSYLLLNRDGIVFFNFDLLYYKTFFFVIDARTK